MKQFGAFALMGAVASAAYSQDCLYCRRQDASAGFLVSYSYCNATQTCLKDAWNYLSRTCSDGWKRGRNIKLDDCEPTDTNCPSYTSSFDKAQSYENQTWSLAMGGKCTVEIDATDFIARVIFSNTNQLGIERPNTNIDDVITIKGGVEEIVLYNGNEKGPLTFDISFSGASHLLAGATSVAAVLAYMTF